MSEAMQLARKEFARSFDPRDWYERDDPDDGVTTAAATWVCRPLADGAYAVGRFDPDLPWVWVEESRWLNRWEAADRIERLNGGT